MPQNMLKLEMVPSSDPERGPSLRAHGKDLNGDDYDETFECWAEPPAKSVGTVDVVEVNGRKMIIGNPIDAIKRLLVTRKPELVDVTNDDGTSSSETKWVKADDVDRFQEMIDSDDVFVPVKDLTDAYQDLSSELARRPTSRSRR